MAGMVSEKVSEFHSDNITDTDSANSTARAQMATHWQLLQVPMGCC